MNKLPLTPQSLVQAVLEGSIDEVKRLTEAGVTDESGEAFRTAAYRGKITMMEIFLPQASSVAQQNAIVSASSDGKFDALSWLLGRIECEDVTGYKAYVMAPPDEDGPKCRALLLGVGVIPCEAVTGLMHEKYWRQHLWSLFKPSGLDPSLLSPETVVRLWEYFLEDGNVKEGEGHTTPEDIPILRAAYDNVVLKSQNQALPEAQGVERPRI
jgi:hypothetical protein